MCVCFINTNGIIFFYSAVTYFLSSGHFMKETVSVYLYLYPHLCPSIHPSIYPSTHPSIYASFHPFIYPPIHLSVCLSIHPSIHSSFHPSIQLSIYPRTHTSICLSTLPTLKSTKHYVEMLNKSLKFLSMKLLAPQAALPAQWKTRRHLGRSSVFPVEKGLCHVS